MLVLYIINDRLSIKTNDVWMEPLKDLYKIMKSRRKKKRESRTYDISKEIDVSKIMKSLNIRNMWRERERVMPRHKEMGASKCRL